MEKADGGVVAVTVEGHRIANLKVERVGDAFVVVCECGARSKPHVRMEHAVAEWQRHRDRF